MSNSTNFGNIRVLDYDPKGTKEPRSKVIDYMKSSENYVGARFIFECGKLIKRYCLDQYILERILKPCQAPS